MYICSICSKEWQERFWSCHVWLKVNYIRREVMGEIILITTLIKTTYIVRYSGNYLTHNKQTNKHQIYHTTNNKYQRTNKQVPLLTNNIKQTNIKQPNTTKFHKTNNKNTTKLTNKWQNTPKTNNNKQTPTNQPMKASLYSNSWFGLAGGPYQKKPYSESVISNHLQHL